MSNNTEFDYVFNRSLKFLTFRQRSEKEMKNFFQKNDFDEKTCELVSEKLKTLNYINDEEFARWWIEQKNSFKPKGKFALRLELKEKGISDEIIENSLLTFLDEKANLDYLAEKRISFLKGKPPQEIKEKVYSYLGRKGFSFEDISTVVEKLLKKG